MRGDVVLHGERFRPGRVDVDRVRQDGVHPVVRQPRDRTRMGAGDGTCAQNGDSHLAPSSSTSGSNRFKTSRPYPEARPRSHQASGGPTSSRSAHRAEPSVADEEARVRRLVVGGVLPGDRDPVLRVVHQRGERLVGAGRVVLSRSAARVLSEVGQMTSSRQSPRRSPDSAGVALVPLLECTPEPVSSRVSPPVPYLSMWRAVEQLALRVAVPPDQEVGRAGLRPSAPGRRSALRSPWRPPPTTPRRRRLPAQMSAATPRPLSQPRRRASRGSGPVRASAEPVRRAVCRSRDLETSRPGRVGIEVADVHGVAVAEAGVPQPGAVVVDGHRAVDDLVAAVGVDVGDGQLVVALPAYWRAASTVGVERPAPGQRAVAEVPGGDDAAGVVAARHDRGSGRCRPGRRCRPGTGRPGCRRCRPRSTTVPRGGS